MGNPPPSNETTLNDPANSAQLAHPLDTPVDDFAFTSPEKPAQRWRRLEYEPGGFAGLAFVASWGGIVIAGGLLPLVIGLPLLLFNLISQNGLTNFSILELIFGAMLLVISMIAAALWTTIASSFAGTILIMFDWSMGYILNPRTAVSLSAGLSGNIATFSLSVYALSYRTPRSYLLLLLVFLAMTLFHVAGMLIAQRFDRQMFAPAKRDRHFNQFQIRHLLVATAWAAGVLAMDGLFGKHMFASMALIWVVMQAMLLLADWIWVKIRINRRRGRGLRS